MKKAQVQTVLFSDGRHDGFLDKTDDRHKSCEAKNHQLTVYSEGYYCSECDAFFKLGYWGNEDLPSDVVARIQQGCKNGVCEL